MRKTRGFTLIDLLMVIVIIALLVCLLVPVTAAQRRDDLTIRDAMQIKEIHQSMLVHANENEGRLPRPGMINRLPDAEFGNIPGYGDEDHSQNHTANVYSAMIAQNRINADICIGPTEVSTLISEDLDYDRSKYRPAADIYWDDNFVAEIDKENFGSNTSYAHAAICGERKSVKWRNANDSSYPIIGTRSPGGLYAGSRFKGYGGALSGDDFELSPTLKLHGPKTHWIGNVAFSDNHVEKLNTFFPTHTSHDSGNSEGRKRDNIYSCEFDDGPKSNRRHSSSDAWLVFTSGLHNQTEYSVYPIWDIRTDG